MVDFRRALQEKKTLGTIMKKVKTITKPVKKELDINTRVPLPGQPGELRMSYSSVDCYITCPRLFYWRYVARLERIMLNIPFIVGRVIHEGINLALAKKDAMKGVDEEYTKEVETIRKSCAVIDSKEEQKLVETAIIVKGIMKGYLARYGAFLRRIKQVVNEHPFELRRDGVTLIGKIDNVIEYEDKTRYLHEIKTSSYLTVEYVRSIQTDFQTGIYFHTYNECEKIPLKGILYDITQKPGIRQKGSESYSQFLERLDEWYKHDTETKFYMERLPPVLKRDNVFNTVGYIAKQIHAAKSIDDYPQYFSRCYDKKGHGRCEMYPICHEGGPYDKTVMVQFQPKKERS